MRLWHDGSVCSKGGKALNTHDRTSGNMGRLTAKMALELAAPHTWPAAILPTLAAVCMAATRVESLSVSLSLAMLAIVVLFQSAANTFNDYYDCIKGTDGEDDYVDPSDSVLVYNDVDPRCALRLAVGFVAAAFALGIYVIVQAGLFPLLIGVIGAFFVVVYSAGKTPLSYLPLGEAVSGVVMGALVPFAVVQALTGSVEPLVLVWSAPLALLVGLIMFTNNISDIERDVPAQRRTLAIALGRERARSLYHALAVASVVAMLAVLAVWFPKGLIVMPFMVLGSLPLFQALFRNPLTPERRLQSMPQILTVNIVLGAFYSAAILLSASVDLSL